MENRVRVGYFDSLRAVAIVSVIAAHSAQTIGSIQRASSSTIDSSLLSFFNHGGYGVQVFFFLSGYLLAMLYGYSSLDTRPTTSSRTFWIKRFFRIAPLWFLFLIFVTLRPMLFPASPGSWADAAAVTPAEGILGFVVLLVLSVTLSMWLIPEAWEGFIPGGWSIQAEFLHYVFFALTRKWRITNILVGYILLALPVILIDKVLIRVDVDLGILEGWRSQNLPSTLLFFLAGTFAHLLVDKSRRKALSSSGNALLVAFVAVVLLLPLNNVKSGQFFEAVGFVAFALLVALGASQIAPLQALLDRIAKYSYFSYFFHFFALDALEGIYLGAFDHPLPGGQIGVGMSILLTVVVVTALSTSLGALSWKLLERPAIRWGNKQVREE